LIAERRLKATETDADRETDRQTDEQTDAGPVRVHFQCVGCRELARREEGGPEFMDNCGGLAGEEENELKVCSVY